MQLKTTPEISPRYWAAIMVASMCGTNFGDFFPDVLKVSTGVGLMILIALFAAIILADKMTKRRSEAFYWCAILVVRAAATNIADSLIDKQHLGYVTGASALAVLLGLQVAVHRSDGPKPSSGDLPPTNGFYWFTMLTAGALGTVIGDGAAHAFGPLQIGFPISAGMATVAVVLVLSARTRLKWTTAVAYWVAVVAVRWWGTNFGDLLKSFLTIPGSMATTGVVLALILCLSRARRR